MFQKMLWQPHELPISDSGHYKNLKCYYQKYTAIFLSRDALCIYNSVWQKRTPSPMSTVC